ncbi:MAG: GNAT family N-acetyltransferase [Acetobacteraceae bacterium]|nr:GNAT family N-acetyltransferase [Acetobacteraceae bacterium]
MTARPGLVLVRPAREHLASYLDALERGFSPDNVRPEVTRRAQLDAIAADADAFLAAQEDLEPTDFITLPDGSRRPKLPGFRRWMWDGAVLGSIGFRFQPGTVELPAHVLGHIGFAVVPWARRQGVGTRALALLLEEIRPLGLPYVELTAELGNIASMRVMEANGGQPVRLFRKDPAYGGGEAMLFRIPLTG